MSNKTANSVKHTIKKMVLSQGTVGKEITLKIPAVLPEKTIQEVKELLPEFSQKMDSINYIYVVNNKNKLKGVFSIKELYQYAPETKVRHIMVKNPVVSHPQVNKEKVAHLAIKHNFKAIPITDKKGRLIGVLSSDKVLSILYDKYRNSFQHFAGVVFLEKKYETILDYGIFKNIASRLPWIIVGLVGGVFAAQVIEYFETTLSAHIILAVFIPLVVYISNAVGAQTQTFLVRDLAFSPKLNIIPYFFKQFISSTLIGFVCGSFIWLIINLFWQLPYIGLVVGFASFTSISLSTLIAVSIPYFLYTMKQEPASGSGPFATILQDLLSIFIYFLIASILL
jgi:magnesium transporter